MGTWWLEKCDRPTPPGSGEIGDATDPGAPDSPCWAMATKCQGAAVDRLKQPCSLAATMCCVPDSSLCMPNALRRVAVGWTRFTMVVDQSKVKSSVLGGCKAFCCLGWKDDKLPPSPADSCACLMTGLVCVAPTPRLGRARET